jgi:hypothetical protein
MKGFEKFLNPKQLQKKVQEWQDGTRDLEKTQEKLYTFSRQCHEPGFNSISEIHGVSFLNEIIPALIAKRKKGKR